jgi:hypothetical protein
MLNLFRPASAQVVPEPRGLRITLPARRRDTSGAGVWPGFRISGDFEITLGHEILSAETPSKGLGAGVKIWGKIESDDDQRMNLAHMVSPDGERGCVALFARVNEDGEKAFKVDKLSTDANRGQLRLVRTGSELTCLVSVGEDETFDELQRVQVATGPVTALRIAATTSDDPCGLSIRLVDLRIRAAYLGGAPYKTGTSWVWIVLWLLVTAAIATCGFLLWRYRPWEQRGRSGSRR